jgi:hypothetical protein
LFVGLNQTVPLPKRVSQFKTVNDPTFILELVLQFVPAGSPSETYLTV